MRTLIIVHIVTFNLLYHSIVDGFLRSMFKRPSFLLTIHRMIAFENLYAASIECLEKSENLTHIEIPKELASKEGVIKGSVIKFVCKVVVSKHIRWGRLVSFRGSAYNVLNVVLLPKCQYDIPIFGVDIVCLPGGVLAAIDFQPLNKSLEYFQGRAYEPYKQRFAHWNSRVPDVGGIPGSVKDYFSPTALWTRFPLNDTESLSSIGSAFLDYMDCYRDLLANCPVTDPSILSVREEKLAAYLNYRIENDPAKNLLHGAFGKEWTDRVLREVIFPKDNLYS